MVTQSSNRQEPAYSTNNAQYEPKAAVINAPNGTNVNPQVRSIHALHLDPFAYYKAFVDAAFSQSQGINSHDLPPNERACICHGIPGKEDVQDGGDQQHARGRAVPYNLAVRLANRSNGAPLATIVEQGSYSTLNSRSSLPSVGRFPSLRVVENTSPSRASLAVSPGSDGHALRCIAEVAQQERVLSSTIRAHEMRSYKDSGSSFPIDETVISPVPATLEYPQIIQYQASGIECDGNSWTVKGFFRGILHNVRAGSRTRSLSSSTHASVAENQEDLTKTSDNDPHNQIQACKTLQPGDDRLKASFRAPIAPFGATKSLAPEHQINNAPRWTTSLASLAYPDPTLPSDARNSTPSQTEIVAVFQSLPPLVATHAYERSCSIRLVRPEPRDEPCNGYSVHVPTFPNQSGNLASAGSAFYGVSASSNATHSLTGNDRGQEASQNASFCSTISTSYSGTVVGVDIDLQHEFPLPVRRSRSPTPVAPVWFTPQMAELERQASTSESLEIKQVQSTEPPRRSITSSALTTLLPIAAASGIVRPNYETPKISFFSPSGNLIQPEGSSTSGTTSASEFSGSPTMNTPNYTKATPAAYSVFSATCLPPPRPLLRPMVTPPTSSAPLPANLQCHHNYRRPEQSKIDSSIESTESFIVPARAVKGCDGIVRTNARPTYAQMRPSAEEAEQSDALQRTSYMSRPHQRKSEAINTAGKKRIHIHRARRRPNTGFLGPLAGHVLRICFCQPYDGAGESTHDVAADTLCTSNHNESMHEKPNKRMSHYPMLGSSPAPTGRETPSIAGANAQTTAWNRAARPSAPTMRPEREVMAPSVGLLRSRPLASGGDHSARPDRQCQRRRK
ncbi:hypothetical protein TW65_08328 [Stemphylium lycopersici]|nr:hypothetical protein TW65_08328 [Stemphylium lycopersici]